MTSNTTYWKRLWRWINTESLSSDDLIRVLSDKNVKEELKLGLSSYKALKTESYSQLQTKYPDQTKLLNVVQSLQHYIGVDSFQVWDILKHYLCDISYGTPENALKNVAFVDTRLTYLLPNLWKFYYKERLFLLKLLLHLIEFKDDDSHNYNVQFKKTISDIGLNEIKKSLLDQLDKLLIATPPPRKIHNDFSCDTIRIEWAESNLREQITILQTLLLIANETNFSVEEFTKLFDLFKKNSFGKRQNYNDLLEERHKDYCVKIQNLEVCLFMVIMDGCKINNVTKWIDGTKQIVENELTKLQLNEEHSALLITWMMLTLQSEQHARLFESHYQHFGATALKLHVFEFLKQCLDNPIFSDNSKCALIAKHRIFNLLNELCDKFDGDGTLSHQPGVMQLGAQLLENPSIAREFWKLHAKEENTGIISLWNTALEYFPFNFSTLSLLAAGLAQAGQESVRNLLAELKCLPVYTEVYHPNVVPLMSLESDDAVIGRDYYPLGTPAYHIDAGSTATIMERKEGTLIHFRTPYSYWTIFNHEIEKCLDRQGQHHHNLKDSLERFYEGTNVLKGILKCLSEEKQIPKILVAPSEGVFDVLIRFTKTDATPLQLLVSCLEVCTSLIPVFPKEIHLRLINTGLLPRIMNCNLSHVEYANGASFDSAAVGSYLVNMEQSSGAYNFLGAYLDMISAFYETTREDRIVSEIILPGLVLVLREVFPNIWDWRYRDIHQRRLLFQRCLAFLNLLLQNNRGKSEKIRLVQRTCVYSLTHTENAVELLKIVAMGNEQLEQLMIEETNWTSGSGSDFILAVQKAVTVLMFVLKLKSSVAEDKDVTPLEHLIFAQIQHKNSLKVVPKVTSYINHVFNESLAVLACRLLRKFAEGFQMSLFSSLDMTAYQVRVMFLDRLRDDYERPVLKIVILEFVATCIGKQPGLTEAFFKLNYTKAVKDEEGKEKAVQVKQEKQENLEGILGYMADYLGSIKSDAKCLQNPLLACIMALFHALWKNNMQILVKELREHANFWDHMTSPLFNDIQPEVKTYSQIFNVLGIEIFLSRDKIDPTLREMFEVFFDTSKNHLDKWINYIFSFKGRDLQNETVDKVPTWLSLLTSWKDFTTIFCKYPPLNLNIAHKTKMVAPCMRALLDELEDLRDGRLVVILSELYVIMLKNWKDDCFDNSKTNAKQIDNLLNNTSIVYDCLHPRAKRSLLAIGTVAISSLDYEIKANRVIAQSIIRSVTNINSMELEKLFDDIKDMKKDNGPNVIGERSPVVLSLALLEQCLDLYDHVFSGLSQWFQSTKFTNKLLCCLQTCLQSRRHYHTSLAALKCLTAYARGPFSKDLLLIDIDQFLWLQLLPPKFENTSDSWKVQEWWHVYGYSLDFISMMVMKHGQFFAGTAITFVGVHLEYIIEAILLPRQVATLDSLNLCASALNLIVHLVKFESRWRIENINSLVGVMRSISWCVHQCVWAMLRSRRPSDATHPPDDAAQQHTSAILHRTMELLHMSTLCLLSFSPDLLSLLAEPGLDLERWQPLVEIDFGSPKLAHDQYPQLTFGTLLTAICLLTKTLNHAYQFEEWGGSRSPRRRRCVCGSPGAAGPGGAGGATRAGRSDSITSVSSVASAPLAAMDDKLLAATLHAVLALLASQALLAVRDPNMPSRHKQLIRRELSSELTVFHDFVRKRILCGAHARPHLVRNKLGAWPLAPDEEEVRRIEEATRRRNPEGDSDRALPPPPPPKRVSTDSMREYILRKHYLDKCAQTPTKEPPSPVSHSTPTSDKKKDASRSSKRVSWAETTRDTDEDLDTSLEEIEPAYSNLTDVQINTDEDFFHFMSVVFLCICQTDL